MSGVRHVSGGSDKSATLYGSTQDDPVRKPENRVRGGLLAESLASSGVTKQASCPLLQQGFSHNSVESHAGCCYEWVVLATCYLALSVKSVSCPGCSECYILSRKRVHKAFGENFPRLRRACGRPRCVSMRSAYNSWFFIMSASFDQ